MQDGVECLTPSLPQDFTKKSFLVLRRIGCIARITERVHHPQLGWVLAHFISIVVVTGTKMGFEEMVITWELV